MTVRDLSVIKGLDPKTIEEALVVLRRESDRGAILVAIAILDSVFAGRLEQLLSHGNSDARSRLLTRSFNSFASKVDVAYCIGMIPKLLYQDIRLLNKLRNQCAHEWGDFRVTQQIVDAYIEPMGMKHALDAANEVNPILFPPGCPPRQILISTLAALITFANLFKPLPRAAVTESTGVDG
ncbi:hypothetical protein ABU614_07050 [Lysobacter firmicutimachus]|uniref:Transcriptional regulator n=1 Tax=Lysobacter firmicutimachus TaxID=1792846 RepID=A0AAU8MXU6_9GAMM